MGILSVFSLSGGKGGEGILHIKCIKAKEKKDAKNEKVNSTHLNEHHVTGTHRISFWSTRAWSGCPNYSVTFGKSTPSDVHLGKKT